MIIPSEFVENLGREIVSLAQEDIQNVFPLAYDYIEAAMDLRETLKTRLQELPPKDFVGTLRPVFQQDEIKLIIVGAFLGMLIGFLQEFLIFNWI